MQFSPSSPGKRIKFWKSRNSNDRFSTNSITSPFGRGTSWERVTGRHPRNVVPRRAVQRSPTPYYAPIPFSKPTFFVPLNPADQTPPPRQLSFQPSILTAIASSASQRYPLDIPPPRYITASSSSSSSRSRPYDRGRERTIPDEDN